MGLHHLYGRLLLVILLSFSLPVVFGDQLVVNSQEWQDVYSAELYQHLTNKGKVFYIVEESQGLQLITDYVISPKDPKVLLLESEERPFVAGFQAKLEERGFTVEKLSSERPKDTNQLLVQKLLEEQPVDGFILIDGDLGYSAVSVAPYALLTNSAVLFADKENIDSIYDLLSENEEIKVLLYGHIDREVRAIVAEFNPEVIDTGDRYKDNIEIVKRFLEISPKKMVYMTNGEFLEDGFFTNEFPILFVGTTNVPLQVTNYIKESSITTGVVIGYDLFQNAVGLRKETGLDIFLKHAQGRKGELYALNIFPIPSYKPKISVEAVRYNEATRKLEVVYRNLEGIYTHVQTISHDVMVDEKKIASVADEKAFFLDGEERKTQVYDVDLTDYREEEMILKSEISFGESPSTLTFLLSTENSITIISADDDSEIEIVGAAYNQRAKRFEVTIKNIGVVDTFADPEVQDVIVAGEKVTAGTDAQRLDPDEEVVFKIPLEMIEEDFEDNPQVTVYTRYGEREDALIKSKAATLAFVLKGGLDTQTMIMIVVVLLVFWLFFLIRKKKKEEDRHH